MQIKKKHFIKEHDHGLKEPLTETIRSNLSLLGPEHDAYHKRSSET